MGESGFQTPALKQNPFHGVRVRVQVRVRSTHTFPPTYPDPPTPHRSARGGGPSLGGAQSPLDKHKTLPHTVLFRFGHGASHEAPPARFMRVVLLRQCWMKSALPLVKGHMLSPNITPSCGGVVGFQAPGNWVGPKPTRHRKHTGLPLKKHTKILFRDPPEKGPSTQAGRERSCWVDRP